MVNKGEEGMKSILVISPHPDDAEIGCGGTIRNHVLAGDFVHVLYLTSGTKDTSSRLAITREWEAGIASQVLGFQGVAFWRYSDGAFKADVTVATRLDELLDDLAPDLVYAPHEGESHPDHVEAWSLANRCVRDDMLRLYEVWTPLQVVNYIEDITSVVSNKRSAIRAHTSQLTNAFDEAILALNHYRGLMSGKGYYFAEAFG